jgi:choline dehydrogenase-like flavoprotein
MRYDLLQMVPAGQMRRNADMWRGLQEFIDDSYRVHEGAARSASEPDRAQDRVIPVIFPAKITGATVQTAISATRNWWTYQWEEVVRDAAAGTWTVPTTKRTSARFGDAWNAYETTADNDGDNILAAGTTVTRLVIPNDRVVAMHIDITGKPWFSEQNPLDLSCAEPLNFSGGEYFGGI